MSFKTKQSLDNSKFFQQTGTTLTLSGNTIIGGTIRYATAPVITGNTQFVHKQFVLNAVVTGNTASNGLTKVGTNIRLGGSFTGNTSFTGNYDVSFGGATGSTSAVKNFIVNSASGSTIFSKRKVGLVSSGTSITLNSQDKTNTNNALFGSGFPTRIYSFSPDKYFAVGFFDVYNGYPAHSVVKFSGNREYDTSFNSGLLDHGTYISTKAALQLPNGKVLVGGYFTAYNGVTTGNLIQLNSDGTLDESFNIGTGVFPTTSVVAEIKRQSDGKLIIGGNFSSFNGQAYSGVVRLNTDGSVDTTFNSGNAGLTGLGSVNSIEVLGDDKIIIGGLFATYNGTTARNIVKLNADGTKDTSFATTGFTTHPNAPIYSLKVDLSNKVVVVGTFSGYSGNISTGIVRLNSNGTRDTSFTTGTGLKVGAFDGTGYGIGIQADGKYIITGGFNSYSGITKSGVLRLNTNGVLDTTFNNGGLGSSGTMQDVVIGSDNRIYIVGQFSSYNAQSNGGFVILNPDGSISTLNKNVPSIISNHVIDYDNDKSRVLNDNSLVSKNYVVGRKTYTDKQTMFATVTGSSVISPGFNIGKTTGSEKIGSPIADMYFNTTLNSVRVRDNNGWSSLLKLDSFANGLSAQGNKVGLGGILTGNTTVTSDYDLTLKNVSQKEKNLSGFDDGSINAFVEYPNGKILVGGSFTKFNGDVLIGQKLVLLNLSGELDNTFISGGGIIGGDVNTLVYDNNLSQIIVGGTFTNYDGNSVSKILRIDEDGTIDTSFVTGTGFNGVVNSIVVDFDGKYIVTGTFTNYDGDTVNRIVRLETDGTLDATFLSAMGSGINGTVHKAIIDNNTSNVVVVGTFTTYNGTSRNGITRINITDGSLDTTFSGITTGSVGSIIYSVAQDFNDNGFLIGGTFSFYNSVSRNKFAKLTNSGAIDFSFNTAGIPITNGDVYTLLMDSSLDIVIAGDFDGGIVKRNVTGGTAVGFNSSPNGYNEIIRTSIVTLDGNYLLGGDFTNYKTTNYNRISLIDSDGSIISSFNTDIVDSIKLNAVTDYTEDFSTTFRELSLVNKGWVDVKLAGITGGTGGTDLSGYVTGATNLATSGDGEGLFVNKSAKNLRFKRLVAGANITLTPTSTGITITSSGGGGGSTTLTGDVTGSGTGSFATTFRNFSALSVLGRIANSTGAPTDIAAGTSGHSLRRNGNGLGFGTITGTTGLSMATARLLGRTTASFGLAEEITVGAGLTLATGSIVVGTAGITSAMLRNSAGVSVIGRSANSTGVPADIAAASEGQILRRFNNVLAFGTVTGTTGVVMSTARILGRTTAATGLAEEITVNNGLLLSGVRNLRLGGALTGNTTISGTSSVSLYFSGSTGYQGIRYSKNYGSNFVARSLVDAGFLTGLTSMSPITGATNLGSGAVPLFAQKNGKNLEFKRLVAGTNITLTPTSTGITITSSGGGGSGTVTGATNGLSLAGAGKKVKLGGTLTGDTTINIDQYNLSVVPNGNFQLVEFGSDTKMLSNLHVSVSGSGSQVRLQAKNDGSIFIRNFDTDDNARNEISISAVAGGLDIINYTNYYTSLNAINTGLTKNYELMLETDTIKFYDNRPTPVGIQYNDDYSATFTDRSFVDKGWVLSQLGGPSTLQTVLTNGATALTTNSPRIVKTLYTGAPMLFGRRNASSSSSGFGGLAIFENGSGDVMVGNFTNNFTGSSAQVLNALNKGLYISPSNTNEVTLKNTNNTFISLLSGNIQVSLDGGNFSYLTNYSSNFSQYSLVDVNYVTGKTTQFQKNITGTTYTVTNADDNYILYATNAAGCNFTLTTGITTNVQFTTVRGTGAGTVSHTAGTGAVFNTVNNETQITSEKAGATWVKRNSSNWYGFGALGNAAGGSATANNGLRVAGSNVVLGGALTGNTTISGTSSITLRFSGSTGFKGVKYSKDYSANFDSRSIVDGGYVTGQTNAYRGKLQQVATTGLTAASGETGNMKYNSTTKTPVYSNGQLWVPVGVYNPDLVFSETDDFMWGTTNLGASGQGWAETANGTAAQIDSTTVGIDSTENCDGVIEINCGTTSTGRCTFSKGTGSILFGRNTEYRLTFRNAVSALSTTGETYTVYGGFFDNPNAGDATDGAYFRYTNGVNGGRWQAVTRNNSVETASAIDTGVSPTAGVFQIFEIRINAAGTSVTYYIDGTLVATNTANIPTGAGRLTGVLMKIEKSVGSTARAFYTDYYQLTKLRTTAR